MDTDENSRKPGKFRESLNDALGLISEYPRLALPVGVMFALFTLASVSKTLIDGFGWAYSVGGILGADGFGWANWVGGIFGVCLVGGIFATVSAVVIRIVKGAIAPRPTIQPLPDHYVSRNPIIKWDYKLEGERRTSYELDVQELNTGEKKIIPVPERMHQIPIPDTTGPLEICVYAVVEGNRIRRSNV